MARRCSTICLPIGKDAYQDLIDDPARFRAWLDQSFRDCPELFPKAFASGYRLKDARASAKTGLRLRRVRLKATGEAFSVRPSFVLPYQTALADDVADALFLRSFGVPFWAIAKVFGKDHDYWYRLEISLGRNSVVAPTSARRNCHSTCWPTSTTRRATARRTTSPPRSARAAAWARPWPRPPTPRTSGPPTGS